MGFVSPLEIGALWHAHSATGEIARAGLLCCRAYSPINGVKQPIRRPAKARIDLMQSGQRKPLKNNKSVA